MTNLTALRRAVEAAPACRETRLIYADALEEAGRPECADQRRLANAIYAYGEGWLAVREWFTAFRNARYDVRVRLMRCDLGCPAAWSEASGGGRDAHRLYYDPARYETVWVSARGMASPPEVAEIVIPATSHGSWKRGANQGIALVEREEWTLAKYRDDGRTTVLQSAMRLAGLV